ncbi:MAG: hypothetical protein EU548_07570, partial [Promethearchaeota archaeon]
MNQTPFTLKGFIQDCKTLLPEYFASLQDSLETKEALKKAKKILLTFLKDYLRQNNNKFGRNQFNVEFINTYLTEKIPEEYKGFMPLSTLQTQKIIRNFVSFLTLHNVLYKNIDQKVVRMSELEERVEEESFNNQEEELMEGYYESFEDILYDKVEQWINSFYESKAGKTLSTRQKIYANEIILTFAEYMYYYCYQSPEDWDPVALEEVCLYHFPHRLIESHDFFAAISHVLMVFLRFLSSKGIIPNAQADELSMTLYSISDLIVEYGMEPENWGFLKSALMEARDSGIDMQNEKELNNFIQLKMLENNKKVISSQILKKEEVEVLSTGEIIKKLRRLGVEFQKEQFLKDVHRFYSASELVDKWEQQYHIKADDQELYFVWLAAVVLWERLAPNVINAESVERLILEGYDLLDELRTKEACDAWLKAWDYLKELIPSNIKEIDGIEGIIQLLYSTSDWSHDLAIYLHNAGLEDAEYYHIRIKYILEVLDRFPDSDDDYLFNMNRALAETYFLVGKEEKGEELFKKLIEYYPEHSWGYISLGDQYADIDSKRYDYEKAKSIYQLGLNKKALPKKDLSLRIKSLENEKKGLNVRKTLITRYRSSLSQEKLDKNGIQAKMEHIKNFLSYVIFTLRMINFEKILELLEPKDIRIFLGTWVIQHEYVSSETELIDYCKDIKAFLLYILSDDR